MSKEPTPFVVVEGEGRTVEGPVGGPVQFKAVGKQTGDNLVVFVNLIQPGDGPPEHIHTNCDEAWLITEGTFRFKLDGKVQEAPAGAFVFVPRGVKHCFQNVGLLPANLFVMFTPAGMENFFEEFATLPRGPLDMKALDTMSRRAGMVITGPPLR
jgi:quercetin dioxygenase-like cupin family protein